MEITVSPLILAVGFVVVALIMMLIVPRLAVILAALCFIAGIGVAALSFAGVL